MSELIELKASVFDLIVQQEALNAEIQRLEAEKREIMVDLQGLESKEAY